MPARVAAQRDQRMRRLPQHSEGARDVVALAAGHISHALRLGAVDGTHLIHKEGCIENGVEGDAQDHG